MLNLKAFIFCFFCNLSCANRILLLFCLAVVHQKCNEVLSHLQTPIFKWEYCSEVCRELLVVSVVLYVNPFTMCYVMLFSCRCYFSLTSYAQDSQMHSFISDVVCTRCFVSSKITLDLIMERAMSLFIRKSLITKTEKLLNLQGNYISKNYS